MFLRGYPFLRDIENLAFQGENTLKFSVDEPVVPSSDAPPAEPAPAPAESA